MPPPPSPAAPDKAQLRALLGQLMGAVEELLLAGLTTASKSTIERMDVTFKEASRMRLLRLGSNLRIANEEISRFTTGSAQFSPRRLSFFLSRTWLLASAMQRALDQNDDPALNALMATAATQPVEKLSLVTLGIGKRVVPGAFAAFEFRLRAIADSGPIKKGEALVWSCVFPMRKDLTLPAEAFLHLPQKGQKNPFKPSGMLEKKVIHITQCAISRQPTASTRLSLGEASEVTFADPFTDWSPFWNWQIPAAAARLAAFHPSPLDLEVELQEEVFLTDWTPGENTSSDEGFDELTLTSAALPFAARLDRGPSGIPLHAVMTKMATQKKRPPLFGVAHYEACKVVFQPLTALVKEAPEYLTVSPDKISQAELVKAMKFT